ncbi:MAG: AMIN domain-containing protein, partial [Stenotrophobium sp.]
MRHLTTNILKQRGRGLGLLLTLGAMLFSTGALADATRALQSVDFVALSGDRVLLTLTLSEPAPDPVVFTIEKPARLSMDLPDTRISVPERYRKIGVGKVQAVGMAEAKGRTRVVVEMSELLPHTVRVDGNKIFLQLGGNPATSDTSAPVSTASAFVSTARPAPAQSGSGQISNIDFRRGEKGEGRVLVTLADD